MNGFFSSKREVAESGCMQQQIQWAHSLFACVPWGSLMEYSVNPQLWAVHCSPRLPKRGHSPSSRRSQLWAWVFCEVHHAQGCPWFSRLKSQAKEFICNTESGATLASFSWRLWFCCRQNSITLSKSNTITSLRQAFLKYFTGEN